MILKIVFYTDNSERNAHLSEHLEAVGFEVSVLDPQKRPWNRFLTQNFDLVVVGQSVLPGAVPGAIEDLRRHPDSPGIIVLTETEDAAERANFLAAGCEAVLNAGLPAEKMAEVLEVISIKIRDQRARLLVEGFGALEPRLADFVSLSPVMRNFMRVVYRVVNADSSLLILGETGVGKERLARAIHYEGKRATGPFTTINCGALPESLLESELFGHEKGAFTGASRTRRGWIELADRGTIFLDEIGEMPQHLQVKLLRVLQEHEIQRLGSEKTLHIDVRVIAATNRNLESDVEKGIFRRDLFYRLSVVGLTVPPLRERREDIPGLVDRYIKHFRDHVSPHVEGISRDALQVLCNYSWPGNIRELMNIIERAMILCGGTSLTLEDLPESMVDAFYHAYRPEADGSLPGIDFEDLEEIAKNPWRDVRRTYLQALEHKYLEAVLKATQGRIGEAARKAGINPRSLYEKMRRYGLRKEDHRQ